MHRIRVGRKMMTFDVWFVRLMLLLLPSLFGVNADHLRAENLHLLPADQLHVVMNYGMRGRFCFGRSSVSQVLSYCKDVNVL